MFVMLQKQFRNASRVKSMIKVPGYLRSGLSVCALLLELQCGGHGVANSLPLAPNWRQGSQALRHSPDALNAGPRPARYLSAPGYLSPTGPKAASAPSIVSQASLS